MRMFVSCFDKVECFFPCGKIHFVLKLGLNNFFGKIVKTEWVSSISLSKSREAEIQSCFNSKVSSYLVFGDIIFFCDLILVGKKIRCIKRLVYLVFSTTDLKFYCALSPLLFVPHVSRLCSVTKDLKICTIKRPGRNFKF